MHWKDLSAAFHAEWNNFQQMELFLIRHGESLANVGLTDELDSLLTPLGECQAVVTGHTLAKYIPTDGAYTIALVSPFRRTLMTCERIVRLIDAPAEVYEDLHEYTSDKRFSTFRSINPDQFLTEFSSRLISSHLESPWQVTVRETTQLLFERANRIRCDLLERYPIDSRLILVSHAEPIARLIEAFCLQFPAATPPPVDNCSIWRLHIPNKTDPAEIVQYNDTSHLAGLV